MVVEIFEGDRPIVKVKGEIDVSNVAELDSALKKACEKSPKGFVVDASGISYVDATGLRTILSTWRRLRSERGILALIGNDILKRLLEIINAKNLPGLFICDSINTAIKLLSSDVGMEECLGD
jgi:anti-anti-sigma factor